MAERRGRGAQSPFEPMRRTRGCLVPIVIVALAGIAHASVTCSWKDWRARRTLSFELDNRAPAWLAAFSRSEDIAIDRGCVGHPEWKMTVLAHEDVTYALLGGGEEHRVRDKKGFALLGAVADQNRIARGEEQSVAPFDLSNSCLSIAWAAASPQHT
jgi:hypothetical protein